jgi:hypothetical protein
MVAVLSGVSGWNCFALWYLQEESRMFFIGVGCFGGNKFGALCFGTFSKRLSLNV